ncbi:MAG TPA: hypothetical protein PK073_14070 [Ignavibacteriaceae bacterium]|nr:hypothetical protein [Ignavibacteriaceae bacterium]
MELKIKVPKGNYALRSYDKNGSQIFYTSTRIGGINFEKDSLTCTIPTASVNYELKDITKHQVVKSGKVKEDKDVQDK